MAYERNREGGQASNNDEDIELKDSNDGNNNAKMNCYSMQQPVDKCLMIFRELLFVKILIWTILHWMINI